jgi:hypothetical protein
MTRALADKDAPIIVQPVTDGQKRAPTRPGAVAYLVEVGDPALGKLLEALLPTLGERMLDLAAQQRKAEIEQLVAALAPKLKRLGEGETRQAFLNAKFRATFLEQYPVLSSAQLADLTGSTARNRAATANRWKAEGRIFSVTHEGADLFPAFQFNAHGAPRPLIKTLLSIFAGHRKGWEVAAWFVHPNGWLPKAAKPIDLLDSPPDPVIEAAKRDVEPFEG